MVEKNAKIIEELRHKQANKECMNCHERGTTYVVMNLGIFVCSRCAGLHRELNHKVKGLGMCTFKNDEIEFIQKWGNEKAKEVWFHSYKKSLYPEPNPKDTPKMKDFMKAVYEFKRFCKSEKGDEDNDEDEEEDHKAAKKKIKKKTSGKVHEKTDEEKDKKDKRENKKSEEPIKEEPKKTEKKVINPQILEFNDILDTPAPLEVKQPEWASVPIPAPVPSVPTVNAASPPPRKLSEKIDQISKLYQEKQPSPPPVAPDNTSPDPFAALHGTFI